MENRSPVEVVNSIVGADNQRRRFLEKTFFKVKKHSNWFIDSKVEKGLHYLEVGNRIVGTYNSNKGP
jgi:hypothetical protein